MLTVEPEPSAAAIVFPGSGQLAQARHFAEQLAQHGETLGLIGPLELPRLWTRHIINSALLAPLLHPGRVGDVGSGAGFPGLALAIARPDVQFVLIEPMARRCEWLDGQIAELGLDNVVVERSRAEDVLLHRALDQVTARAVSALRTLFPMVARLAKPGGELLLLKGAGAEREIDAAQKVIQRLRLVDVRVEELGNSIATEPTRVVRAVVL